jgi:hypothetical protein
VKGTPGATLNQSRGDVSLTCDGFPFMLLGQVQAAQLRDAITAALGSDEDPTPVLGTKASDWARGVRKAWRAFSGDMRHHATCPAFHDPEQRSRIDNPDCECGLRDLFLAFESEG